MIDTLSVHSNLEAATKISKQLPGNALESDKRLYTVLLALSFDWIEEKQYSVTPSFVTFHSSLTCIAAVLGVSRWTVWRSLARLKNLGLVDARVQKGRLFDKVRNTGTVIQVKLVPGAGSNAKLSYQDLKHAYKDMTRLARCKRLSHQVVQHINRESDQYTRYLLLKEWTVKPYTHKNPVIDFRLHGGIETLLSVPGLQGKEVARGIDTVSRILADALADKASTDFYRKLLWGLKRRIEATGLDEFHTVYLQVNRIIRADVPEWQGLRSPGALLVSRLRKFAWWQEVVNT